MKIENIDKFGNCVVCHRNLIKNVVLNGKVEGVFDADKDEVFMKLNNGSIMPVSICKQCKSSIDLSSSDRHDQIMQAVQNGWALEIDYMDKNPDKFPDWDPVKKEKLQKHYSKLNIVTRV